MMTRTKEFSPINRRFELAIIKARELEQNDSWKVVDEFDECARPFLE